MVVIDHSKCVYKCKELKNITIDKYLGLANKNNEVPLHVIYITLLVRDCPPRTHVGASAQSGAIPESYTKTQI